MTASTNRADRDDRPTAAGMESPQSHVPDVAGVGRCETRTVAVTIDQTIADARDAVPPRPRRAGQMAGGRGHTPLVATGQQETSRSRHRVGGPKTNEKRMIRMTSYDEDMEYFYAPTVRKRPVRVFSAAVQAAYSAWWVAHPEADAVGFATDRAIARFRSQEQLARRMCCRVSGADRAALREALDALQPYMDQCLADLAAEFGDEATGTLEMQDVVTPATPFPLPEPWEENLAWGLCNIVDDQFDGD